MYILLMNVYVRTCHDASDPVIMCLIDENYGKYSLIPQSSLIHINRGPQTLVKHMHISCKQVNIFATIYDHTCYILCIVLAK